jgi:ribosomal-protein-alanine N-acetyltransferase
MIAIRPASSAEAQDLAKIGLAAWEKAIRVWGEDADRLRENAKEAYYDFCTRCLARYSGRRVGWRSCRLGRLRKGR